MTMSEDILFVMPEDRELQFPAMAALQSYVNNYEAKMQANTVTPEVPIYKLRYTTTMSVEDAEFWQRLGIELKQLPEPIDFPASVIELSGKKLSSFYGSGKHVAQVCGAISGVECPPLPKVRSVKCDAKFNGCLLLVGNQVHDLLMSILDVMPHEISISSTKIEELLLLSCGGRSTVTTMTPIIIGRQGWETYAAAAMGLPVIEILPRDRDVNWLSKFKSPLYRLLEEDRLVRLPDAVANIAALLEYLEEQRCQSSQAPADKPSPETPTEPIAFTAIHASNLSATPRFGLEKSPVPFVKKP